MTLPNFLIVGAAKTGTTSLHYYLQQHPEIFISPRQEPSFFAHEGQRLDFRGPGDEEWRFVTDLAAYERLFETAVGYGAVGEISPRYLFFERACARIRHYLPQVRLIAILRHPVDRAYSHFLMNQKRNCEPAASFPAAIAMESERMAMGWGWDWSYVGAGLYHAQLSRYYRAFPRSQIKVFLYEELERKPRKFFQDLFAFLEVDAAFSPNSGIRQRRAGRPRSQLLHQMLVENGPMKSVARRLMPTGLRAALNNKVGSWNTVRPEPLPDELRSRLFRQYFAEDCAQLAALIDKDLSSWWGRSLPQQASLRA